MSWTVYILQCADGSLYTGITKDVARRLSQHGAGCGSAYTRARRPLEIVFTESSRDRGSALRREAAIRRLTRPAKLELIRAARP